ncbi:MAG: SHOCT domain-containing protein [Oscillospiraceae bacterium]
MINNFNGNLYGQQGYRDIDEQTKSGLNSYYSPQRQKSTSNSSPSRMMALLVVGWVVMIAAFGMNAFLGVAILIILVFVVIRMAVGTTKSMSGKTSKSQWSNQNNEGHLCDPEQHTFEDNSGRETLSNMESGYSTYDHVPAQSNQFSYAQNKTNSYLHQRMLTQGEFSRKSEELRSLRDAGIITPEEYGLKLREYTAYTKQ